MNVSCPNCATVYRVDPAKVPEGGVRARCSICSAVFAVGREAEARAATPPAPPAPILSVPPPAAAAPAPMPSSPRADQPRSVPPAPMMPAAPPPAPAVPPGAASRPTSFPPPAVPAAAPRPAMPPAAPMPPAPAMSRAAAAPPAPAAPPPAPAPPQAPAPVKPTAVTGSRPVNPFLSQDPALKARRLARALISDMVVYHPAKRQEGLRDGNLKQLFDEEIRKSWEEYAEQVGKDVADSTPYFKEALNEILAGGRQIF